MSCDYREPIHTTRIRNIEYHKKPRNNNKIVGLYGLEQALPFDAHNPNLTTFPYNGSNLQCRVARKSELSTWRDEGQYS